MSGGWFAKHRTERAISPLFGGVATRAGAGEHAEASAS